MGENGKNLHQWLEQIGGQHLMTTEDIENGMLVGHILNNVIKDCALEMQRSNLVVERVGNWNKIIAQLKKIGIRVSHEDKTKIINCQHEIIFTLVTKIKEYHLKTRKESGVDLSKINNNKDITSAQSLLEFFILAIVNHFNLSVKEATAILSNQSKLFAHILAKGLKAKFEGVVALVAEVSKKMSFVQDLCRDEENQLFFIQVMKPAIISKSEEVSSRALSLFEAFLSLRPNPYHLIHHHLLNTILLSLKRHPGLSPSIILFTLNTTQFNRSLLLDLQSLVQPVEFQSLLLEIFIQIEEEGKVNKFYEFQGVQKIIINIVSSIKNKERTLSSLNFIIILNQFQLVEPQLLAQGVESLQWGDRVEATAIVHQLFGLLGKLGKEKNKVAPVIYRRLVQYYTQVQDKQIAEMMMIHFQSILQDYPSIPSGSLVEAINSKVQKGKLQLSSLELYIFLFLVKQNMEAKTALIIYNLVSKLVIDSLHLQELSIQIIISLLKEFMSEDIFVDMSSKLIQYMLSLYFSNRKKSLTKRKSLMGGNAQNEQDTLQNYKNSVYLSFISRIIQIGSQQLNSPLEDNICSTIHQLNKIDKEKEKKLLKILALFGDPHSILKSYEENLQQMIEEQKRKQEDEKNKLNQSQRYDSPMINSGMQQSQSPRQTYVGVTSMAFQGLEKFHRLYVKKLQNMERERNKRSSLQDRESFLKQLFARKMLQSGIKVKQIKDQPANCLYEFNQREKELQEDTVKGKLQLPYYYQPGDEEQRDVKSLEYTMKKYYRVMKVYYYQYTGHRKPRKADSFSEISTQHTLLEIGSLIKLLKQHHLYQFISSRQMHFLTKIINVRLKKGFQDPTSLDFEGFSQFLIQASMLMFTRPPKDLRGQPVSDMIEETFSYLKIYCTENKINQQLFQDPDNIYFNQTEAVRQLNIKLKLNSDYILPEGYKKVIEKKVHFTHKIFLESMSTTYKNVYEIINELLYDVFKFNIIEPFSKEQTITKARPTLYFNQRQEGQVYSQKISIFMKKEVAKIPLKDRQIGKKAAKILEDIIEAVELGHNHIGEKHENSFIKQIKKKQEELKKIDIEKNKLRIERNIENKSALVQYKDKIKERKSLEKKKLEDQNKKYQEYMKKKSEKQEELKRKVEEYKKIKEEEQRKKKFESKEKRKKQREQMEERIRELQQNKRKKEELKQQRLQDEKRRRKEEEEKQKRKKQQQKIRVEEEQKKRKQMIEEFKSKKAKLNSQINQKALDIEEQHQNSEKQDD